MESPIHMHKVYLKMALCLAEASKAEKLKVGCLIVKNRTIIAEGYNGTPAGWDNTCELEYGTTKLEVLHAESNAIIKLARSTGDSVGATIYITVPPCLNCAKLILQAGIINVIYANSYNTKLTSEGIKLLNKAGIPVLKLDL